jgi:hypothetical protein
MTHVSDEKTISATGKSWEEWFALLDAAGAREITHRAIAVWVTPTSFSGLCPF